VPPTELDQEKTMKNWKTVLLAIGATALLAGPAMAVPVMLQECIDDSDCMDNEICMIAEGSEMGYCEWAGDEEDDLTCTSDADCGEGMICSIPSTSDNPSTPAQPPCDPDDPDCEGEDKMPPAPEPDPIQPTEGICVDAPQPCASDADCADDEVCIQGPTAGGKEEPGSGGGSSGSSGSGTPGSADSAGGGPAYPDRDPAALRVAPEGYCGPAGGGWSSECEEDTDCPSGMICDEVGSMGVAIGVPACICPAEEPDCDCGDEMDPMPAPEPVPYFACVPAPCESDSECGDNLVCITITYEECEDTALMTRVPCPEDDPDCGPDDKPAPDTDTEPDCETITESFCGPKYFANCEEDADCGEGFACVEEETCGCDDMATQVDDSTETDGEGDSEGAPGPDAPPEDDEPADEDGCSCEPTGDMICELDELPCQSDEDCELEGWTCMVGPTMSSMPCTFDEETGEEDCGEPEITEPTDGQCVPSTWGWGGFGGGYAEAGTMSANDEEGPVVPDDTDDGTDPADDGSGSGSAGSGDGGANGEVPSGGSGGGGGCQGGSAPASGLLAMALVALAWVTRRKLVLE